MRMIAKVHIQHFAMIEAENLLQGARNAIFYKEFAMPRPDWSAQAMGKESRVLNHILHAFTHGVDEEI